MTTVHETRAVGDCGKVVKLTYLLQALWLSRAGGREDLMVQNADAKDIYLSMASSTTGQLQIGRIKMRQSDDDSRVELMAT